MKINLIEDKTKKKFVSKDNIYRFIVVVIILILFFNGFSKGREYFYLKEKSKLLDERDDIIFSYKDKYDKLQKDIKSTERQDRNWALLVREVGYIVQKDIRLNSIELIDGIVEISGIAQKNSSLFEFINNLKTVSYCNKVALGEMKKENDEILFDINIDFANRRRGG